MFYAYILKSLKDSSYYYGSSSDVEERLKAHNGGITKFTKGHRPYNLHYYETFLTRKEAIARERFFKSREGYNWLKEKGII
ncbi:MAG: GIY-YIG nuclease family protein [Ignavibacterium sp.]|nr:GIY-YIG nuclease family protein [Ignavibacterium sp.]